MKKTLFILEDNFAMGQFLQKYLQEHFDIVWKQTLPDSIKWIEKAKNASIIICDLNLADASGYDFINYVRSTEFYDTLPILVLSGNDTSADRIKALQSGVNDYVIKPFSPEELLLRLQNLLTD